MIKCLVVDDEHLAREAVKAFDLDVIDYLLKPISFDRFVMAINKFYERKNVNVIHNETNKPNRNFINIKANRKTYKIDVANIVYILFLTC